ncbi:hypothetical protein GCM10007860_25150 [Chitiniphilus shinanonensis]|uniref:Uncharacterized protein n=1 Tax=Chitiniphilus shinanonensis TaxID=553088 RepID=A0ABQ6BTN4_9NEIS|nr:hypothetical protein GCM10007860_25150 [Chitiniphilus shinanonensis]
MPHESEKAWVSFDGEAVILSEREYVPVRGLVQCKEQVPVVVKEIPEGVGFLVDINIRKGIYLTLDFISTNPLSYLATVARIGHSKNIVSLPGAYVESADLQELQRYGFGFDPESDRPRISLSGRYVSPSGKIDCSSDAYPGVWDIKKKIKVTISGSNSTCEQLFEKP